MDIKITITHYVMEYVPATYANTISRCTDTSLHANLTSKFLLPLSSLVERRTIEKAEERNAAVGSKVQIWGMRCLMGP